MDVLGRFVISILFVGVVWIALHFLTAAGAWAETTEHFVKGTIAAWVAQWVTGWMPWQARKRLEAEKAA